MAEAHTNRRPKPIVAIGLEYPIALQGGVSVLCRVLIEELCATYRVILISPDTPESVASAGLQALLHSHLRWDPAAASRRSSQALAEQLNAAGTDLAHFHFGGNYGWGTRVYGGSPITFSAKRGIKVFTTVHSVEHLLDGFCGPEKPVLLKLALLPAAWAGKLHVLANVAREIAVSRHNLHLLQRWYPVFRARFEQIYHSRLSGRDAAAAESGRDQTIVNVGHIAYRKGQPTLVEAFARIAPRHPAWKLVLVGHFAEAAAETRIRELIAEHQLGERVILTGALPDPGSWMRRAGIYVQPSQAEALGLALQEALALGCPCIGSDVGGIPELIQSGTGLLFPAGDVAGLAQHLDRLIGSPDERARLGAQAARSIRAWGMTREAMVKAHIDLYEQAFANAPGR